MNNTNSEIVLQKCDICYQWKHVDFSFSLTILRTTDTFVTLRTLVGGEGDGGGVTVNAEPQVTAVRDPIQQL